MGGQGWATEALDDRYKSGWISGGWREVRIQFSPSAYIAAEESELDATWDDIEDVYLRLQIDNWAPTKMKKIWHNETNKKKYQNSFEFEVYRMLPPGKVYFCFTFNDDCEDIPKKTPSVSTEYGTWHHIDNLLDDIGTIPTCNHKIYKKFAVQLDTVLQREDPCPFCSSQFKLRDIEFNEFDFIYTNVISVKKRLTPSFKCLSEAEDGN